MLSQPVGVLKANAFIVKLFQYIVNSLMGQLFSSTNPHGTNKRVFCPWDVRQGGAEYSDYFVFGIGAMMADLSSVVSQLMREVPWSHFTRSVSIPRTCLPHLANRDNWG